MAILRLLKMSFRVYAATFHGTGADEGWYFVGDTRVRGHYFSHSSFLLCGGLQDCFHEPESQSSSIGKSIGNLCWQYPGDYPHFGWGGLVT